MRALVRLSIIPVIVAMLGSACFAPRGAQHGTPRPHVEPRQNPKLITLDEIQNSGLATAFDVVETLRPMWLNKRGPQSFVNDGDVWVYMENARLGGRSSLREIAAASVGSMQYLDVKDANYRYGQGHPYGAIVISLMFPPGS